MLFGAWRTLTLLSRLMQRNETVRHRALAVDLEERKHARHLLVEDGARIRCSVEPGSYPWLSTGVYGVLSIIFYHDCAVIAT